MNKLLCTIMLILFVVSSVSCADPKKINGTWFETIGFVTENKKHECVHYEFVVGNLIWSLILIETVIAPIYFLGWSIYEPVAEKSTGCFERLKKK